MSWTATAGILAVLVAPPPSGARDSRAPGDLAPAALAVDAQPNGGASDGNGVLEAGETAVVAPSWRNTTAAPIAATSVAVAFVGPGGGLYTLPDAAASYLVPAGQTSSCAATGDCLTLAIAPANPRPVRHWDATFGETTSSGSAKTWTVHVGDSYGDVPSSSPFYRFVETLLHRGVEGGCAAGSYCPTAPMTRDWMAPFVLTAKDGRYFVPPACRPGEERFADLPADDPTCRWVEELARRGVVTGCGSDNYCPTLGVSREQMAVFVLATREGPSYSPPPCVAGFERFADVPASSPFCRWIEELARRNVVTGCGGGNYCPALGISRQEMSVFVSVTFGLALYGPLPQAYLVNSEDDADDGACSGAHCSLREALLAADASPNAPGVRDEIHFGIAGAGPHTIRPGSALPPIGDGVVVDGYTQAGARPNTVVFGGLDSVLGVELDLSVAGPLTVAATGALVRGLVINRSPAAGLSIRGSGNAVEGCYVGTDVAGTAARPNRTGIDLPFNTGGTHRLGGTDPGQRNLISGNAESGIAIRSSSFNTIQGNLIGTDRSGMQPLGNASGLTLSAAGYQVPPNPVPINVPSDLNVIGGLEFGAGNVVAGNTTSGISLVGTVTPGWVGYVRNTRIQANRIGLGASGPGTLRSPTALGLFGPGVEDTLVGGSSVAPAGNAIAGRDYGVWIAEFTGAARRTRIEGNAITSNGYAIEGSPSEGVIAGNVIGPSGAAAISIGGTSPSGRIAIRANFISGSGGLAIDLAPGGVTPNDPGDGDTGPNGLQNFPVLTSAVSSGGVTTVRGTLNSAPGNTYTIELFQSPSAHPSGHGEGAIFRAASIVVTDGAGNAPFAFVIPAPIPAGQVVTATATDAAGNTSEFSNAVVVTP